MKPSSARYVYVKSRGIYFLCVQCKEIVLWQYKQSVPRYIFTVQMTPFVASTLLLKNLRSDIDLEIFMGSSMNRIKFLLLLERSSRHVGETKSC